MGTNPLWRAIVTNCFHWRPQASFLQLLLTGVLPKWQQKPHIPFGTLSWSPPRMWACPGFLGFPPLQTTKQLLFYRDQCDVNIASKNMEQAKCMQLCMRSCRWMSVRLNEYILSSSHGSDTDLYVYFFFTHGFSFNGGNHSPTRLVEEKPISGLTQTVTELFSWCLQFSLLISLNQLLGEPVLKTTSPRRAFFTGRPTNLSWLYIGCQLRNGG